MISAWKYPFFAECSCHFIFYSHDGADAVEVVPVGWENSCFVDVGGNDGF